MSLNRDMHPRNPYKEKPPDFKALAMEFPEFRQHCKIINNGKISVNFQEDAAVRCLTKTLLKKDFDLDVDLPEGTLVPRIPQRLNYILMIEDLLQMNGLVSDAVGIDIGTGASCIYALLGARKCGWRFIATDGDEHSVEAAHKNVSRNKLSSQICVAHVDSSAKTVLMNVINQLEEGTKFAFCMCNPPFFEYSETERKFCSEPSLGGEKYSNRVVSMDRRVPRSTTFATGAELQVEGGEVAFVNRIIDDSVILRDRISIYTSMLGRKQSIAPLKSRLDRLGDDVKVLVSTLNQGKTMRWILSWTFSSSIQLTPPEPRISVKCALPGLVRFEEQMKALGAKTDFETERSMVFECRHVTWTHQRARRRAEARLAEEVSSAKRARYETSDVACQSTLGVGDGRDSLCDDGNFVTCQVPDYLSDERRNVAVQAYFPLPTGVPPCQILRCRVLSKPALSEDELSFELLSGSKHHLNQLVQYLRNVLCQTKK